MSGSEDLGSGLKASFKVESTINLNAGIAGNSFGGAREGWVGVGGAFGEVKAGQQYSDVFFTVIGTDPNGFNNIVGWGPASAMLSATNGASLVGHTNDTISYVLPTLVEGVTIGINSFRPNSRAAGWYDDSTTTPKAGTVTQSAATTFGTSGNSYRVSYANSGLYAGFTGRSAGADKGTAYAASYDFGVAKIAYSNIDSTIGTVKTADSTYSISAPVGALNIGLSAGTYSTTTGTAAAVKTNNSQLGAYYNLSKRSQLYAIYGKASATSSTTTTAVGVNHAF